MLKINAHLPFPHLLNANKVQMLGDANALAPVQGNTFNAQMHPF